MKRTALAVLSLFCFNLYAHTEARVNHLFVPNGFDNNDKIEVVITGTFPHTCFDGNKVDVKVAQGIVDIKVTSLIKDQLHLRKCEKITIPFSEVVSIGSLQGDNYQIVVNKNGKYELKDSLNVVTSESQGIDDYLYAIVDYVETGFTGGLTGEVMLVGKSPSNCLVLDRVEYKSNGKDTLSVLPILKKLDGECRSEVSYLEVPVKFDPGVFNHKDILLYVRSIDGKSVTSLINKK